MKHTILTRCLLLTTGLFAMALGVAVSTKANLGIPPISCVPYILHLGLPLSMGMLTFILNVIFTCLQIVLLRSQFQLIQLFQVVFLVIFGVFMDLALYIVSLYEIQIESYAFRLVLCLIGIVLIAIGVSMQVRANLVMLPGDGLVAAIAQVFKRDFGKVKVGLDVTFVLSGVFLSYFMLQSIEGVREGTVVAALLVGMIVRFILAKLPVLNTSSVNQST